MKKDEENLKIEEKRKKTKKIEIMLKAIKWIIIVAILFGIFYLGAFYSTIRTSQTKTTKLGLENVGELVTQTAYLTVVEDNEEHWELFNLFEIPFTESRQIFSYDIEVDASVDFAQISLEIKDNKKEKGEIIVKLPHAKIYKSTLKTDSLKVYLDSESLFSRIDLTEHNEAIKEMEEQGIKDAEANGILDAADSNAKTIIERFIKSDKKYENYTITYDYIKN